MKRLSMLLIAALAACAMPSGAAPAAASGDAPAPDAVASVHSQTDIVPIDPPEQDFFVRKLYYKNIPIKAGAVVVDEAFFQARERLDQLLKDLPQIAGAIARAGGELQIIGRDQVTSDLPDFRHLKGKPLEEYNGLTIDQRTRGMGGLHVSCGEENLLRLEEDRYRGRDICQHEFAHCIRNIGMSEAERAVFDAQWKGSLEKGLWVDAYAGSNPDEFFAELTMWYFGTHGDMGMRGEKPAPGREGLKAYDPESCALMARFYRGEDITQPPKPDKPQVPPTLHETHEGNK